MFFVIRFLFQIIPFNLPPIGRLVNNELGIFKGDSKTPNSITSIFGPPLSDFFLLRYLFGEFVQLDVACCMKLNQTTQICALSSTASEVRSINLHRQDHRSGRSARPDGLSHREDRPRDLIKNHDRREPVFSSLFASQTTRAPTR